jgi:hypothetical protein
MDRRRFVGAGRALLILSLAAAMWAVAVALTGGFVLEAEALRVSSHSPWPAAAIALGSGLAGFLLTSRDERGRAFTTIRARLALAAPLTAAALGVAVVFIALWTGSFVASGSDIHGYVSKAHLWAAGRLHVDQPLLRELRWPNDQWAVAPLGYRPATAGDSSVPVYPPGLPLVMALFERLAGRAAVFCVVPLLSGVAVGAPYLMGARLTAPVVGLGSACLMATSPRSSASRSSP